MMAQNRTGIHEERDRKCNIYASHNLLQQEPRHDDYDEESDTNIWLDRLGNALVNLARKDEQCGPD